MPTLRGKCESVFGARHMDKIRKDTRVVSVMTDQHKETCANAKDEKGRSSSPALHSKAEQTDGEGQKSSKESSNKEEKLFGYE